MHVSIRTIKLGLCINFCYVEFFSGMMTHTLLQHPGHESILRHPCDCIYHAGTKEWTIAITVKHQFANLASGRRYHMLAIQWNIGSVPSVANPYYICNWQNMDSESSRYVSLWSCDRASTSYIGINIHGLWTVSVSLQYRALNSGSSYVN